MAKRVGIVAALVSVLGCSEPVVVEGASQPERRISVVDTLTVVGAIAGAERDLLYSPRRPVFVNDSLVSLTNALSEVRFYALDGRLVRTVGRQGSGPSEFSAAFVHGYSDDRLVVIDNQTVAIEFDAGHLEARRTTLRPRPDGNIAVGFLDGGRVVWISSVRWSQVAGSGGDYVRPDVPVSVADLATGAVTEIARVKGLGSWFHSDGTQGSLPLGPVPRITGRGELVVVSEGEEFRLSLYTESGGWYDVALNRPHTPLTSAHLNAWVSEMQALYDARGLPSGVTPLRGEAPPLRSTLPTWTKLFIDTSGCIWARQFALPGESSETWDVISSSGEWPASVDLPVGFALNDVRGDRAVGLSSDEFGVEYLMILQLENQVICDSTGQR